MKKIFSALVAIVVLTACTKDVADRTTKEYFSAFLNSNETMIGFGSAELNDILAKSDYKSHDIIDGFLGETFESLQSSFNLDAPVYYAVEGPIVNDNPKAIYVFSEIKNIDTLRHNFEYNGYTIEKSKDNSFEYIKDGDLFIGYKNNLAVFLVTNEDVDENKRLGEIIAQTEKELAGGTVEEMLEAEGDVVFSMNVESLYETSNTDLEKLDKKKKEKLASMLKGSYIQNVARFEDGAAIFETKNFFSDELKDELFFRTNEAAPVIKKLGSGKPLMGISINLDMAKMQRFTEEYSPETMEMLSEEIGGPFSLAMMAAGNDISAIVDGQLGVVMMGQPNQMTGMVPDFNFYVGLGRKGKMVGETIKDLMSEQFSSLELSENGLAGYSSSQYVPSASGGLQLPEGCENFGKKSISGFINLEDVDIKSLELEGEAKALELVKYITFEYDENGGRLYIKAKEGKENMLKQALSFAMKEFQRNLGV